MPRFPLAPRILAGVGALAVLLYFGLDLPIALFERGMPWSAYALAACSAPLVLFLALLALAPDTLQRILRPISQVDLRDGGHVAAVVVMAGTLFFVLGYGAIFDGVYAYETAYPHGEAPVETGAFAAPALNASLENGTVVLNWTQVAGAESYHIYRGADNASVRLLVAAGNATSYRDEVATPASTWHYRVAADGAAGLGAASADAAVSIPLETNQLFEGLVLNVIVLVLPVMLYVSFVHGHGPAGAARALGLRSDGAARSILVGFGAAVAFLVLLEVAVTVVGSSNVTVDDNERALSIANSVGALGVTAWAGALAIAALSAFSEEVFFRGFLQPRVGLFGQAVFFALAHVNYVNVLEIVVVFTLAFVLGALLKFTKSLWAPIGAHFLFNLLMLLAAIYAPGVGKA